LNFGGLSSGVLPFAFDASLDRTVNLHLSGAAALSLAAVVGAPTGIFPVDRPASSGSDGSITLSNADVWAFSLTNPHVFVGVGVGLTASGSTSGYGVSNGTSGLASGRRS